MYYPYPPHLFVLTRACPHSQEPVNAVDFPARASSLSCSPSDWDSPPCEISTRSYRAIHCPPGIRRSYSPLPCVIIIMDTRRHLSRRATGPREERYGVPLRWDEEEVTTWWDPSKQVWSCQGRTLYDEERAAMLGGGGSPSEEVWTDPGSRTPLWTGRHDWKHYLKALRWYLS